MKQLNAFDWTALVLVIIGGLNWGLVGFFEEEIVTQVFSAGSVWVDVVYGAIGLAALYVLLFVLFPLNRES